MPYIKQEFREDLDTAIEELIADVDWVSEDFGGLDGILNYVISRIVSETINPSGPWAYADIARAIAVFECAKLEFYRRVAGPKEDAAAKLNGDLPCYSASEGS